MEHKIVPITVLTGYLGAGKTTLRISPRTGTAQRVQLYRHTWQL